MKASPASKLSPLIRCILNAADRLADGLKVEAIAKHGLVEAFVIENSPAFALGFQWHPEWRVREDETSMAIFKAFGDACRKHHAVGN